MLKLYIFTDTTDNSMEYIVAKTEKEAKSKCEKYQKAVKEGKQYLFVELTGDDLLKYLYDYNKNILILDNK